MQLSDANIGDKFFHNGKAYLKIDMNPSSMFTIFQRVSYDVVAALDLATYKVMCINGMYEVEEYNCLQMS